MKRALRRLYGAALLLGAAIFIGVIGTNVAAAEEGVQLHNEMQLHGDGVQLYYAQTPGGQYCRLPCVGYDWNCRCIHLPPIVIQ